MAEQTNKEKLDSLIGSVNLLFEKLNSINMDHQYKIEDLEDNLSKRIEEENNVCLSKLAVIENSINKIYGSQEHIYTILSSLNVKANKITDSRILNNDSEISEENDIESLKQEIEAIKATLGKLSNDVTSIQTKLSRLDAVNKHEEKESKKSDINKSIRDLDKYFAKPNVCNSKDDDIISDETLEYVTECFNMESTNSEKDIIKSLSNCKIGDTRNIYVDGEPFKFVKLGIEMITEFRYNKDDNHTYPFEIVYHDFACINYPRLFKFDNSDYKKSEIRRWINNEFIQMLEPEVVKHMVIQNVQTGNDIVKDFVKIPSCTELNVATYPTMIIENDPYELFKVDINYKYTLNSNGYWTRTNCNNCYLYHTIGNEVYGYGDKDQLGIVPIIRIKE